MIRKKVLSRSVFILSILLFCMFILNAPSALAKRARIIRLVVPAAPGDPLTYKDEELARRFNERVKGQYKIQVLL